MKFTKACLLGAALIAALPAFAQNADLQRIISDTAAQDTTQDSQAPQESAQQEQLQTETVESIAPPLTTPPGDADASQPPLPTYENKKIAVLQTLDKLTARTATVTVPVGKVQAVGPLFLDVKSCHKTPPNEQPEAAAFLQVWEAKPKQKVKHAAMDKGGVSQWVFSGWMFASSPALSAMDHAIYDVWLKDCVDTAKEAAN